MFENHFGFLRRPFTAAPDAGLFVANETTQSARESIEYCLRSGQGIAVLTAPAGTGKSMLCQVLMSSLAKEFQVSFLPSPGTSSCLGLLQAIYFGLGQRVKKKHAGITDAEMRLELLETVQEMRVQSPGIVVLVDEAHLLSGQQLEEIRVLSSYHDRGQPLVRPLLCGTPDFEERLLDPSLKAFNQRIRCQTFLNSLTRAESEKFIHEQLSRAGVRNRRVFDIEAIATIVAASEGSPRCLNQLCDHSLYLAARSGESTVSAAIVNTALDELMQLPLEYSRPRSSAPTPVAVEEPTSSVVEFGSLDAETTAPVEAVQAPEEVLGTVEVGGLLDDDPVPAAPAEPHAETVVELGSLDDCDEPVLDSQHEPEGIEEPAGILAEADAAEIPEPLAAAPVVEQAEETYQLQRLDEINEEIEASFRKGLPDAPVTATEPKQPEAATPQFDPPEVCEDLIAAGRTPIDVQAASGGPTAVQDAWTEVVSVESQLEPAAEYISLDEIDAEPAAPVALVEQPEAAVAVADPLAEEELIRSCVDTRKQIASMLDSLESHVSESLSQQYDVVMPEEPTVQAFRIAELETELEVDVVKSEPTSAAEVRLDDRLSRVVRREQGLL